MILCKNRRYLFLKMHVQRILKPNAKFNSLNRRIVMMQMEQHRHFVLNSISLQILYIHFFFLFFMNNFFFFLNYLEKEGKEEREREKKQLFSKRPFFFFFLTYSTLESIKVETFVC